MIGWSHVVSGDEPHLDVVWIEAPGAMQWPYRVAPGSALIKNAIDAVSSSVDQATHNPRGAGCVPGGGVRAVGQ